MLLLLGAGAYAGLRLKRGGAAPRVNGGAVKASRKGKAPWWQTRLKSNQEPEAGASVLPEPSPVMAAQAPAVKAGKTFVADGAKPPFLPSMSGVHVDLDLSESAFQRLESMGILAVGVDQARPEALRAHLKNEIDTLGGLLTKAGVKPE